MPATERFLVTGALGCIGAWTVRELVREGTPVVAFDLAADPRRLRLIMSPGRARRSHVRPAATSPTSATIERVAGRARDHPYHPSRRPAGAVLPGRSAARRAGQRRRARSTSSRRPAPPRPDGPRLVYASSIAVFDAADADASDRVVCDGDAGPPDAPTTASTSRPTRATPGSTGRRAGWPASACAR